MDGKTVMLGLSTDLSITVDDTIDFCPGDLGSWVEQFGTRPLKRLEANGWAHDVPITVQFKTETEYLNIDGRLLPDEFDPEKPPKQPPGHDPDGDPDTVPTVRSMDPNDIIGPPGVGTGQWIPPETLLPYTIRFENDPQQATAPAQEVFVTNQLDPEMDWETFELGVVGFAGQSVEAPPGSQEFALSVATTNLDGSPLLVQIEASLDLAAGVVSWSLRSIDPDTGLLPADPLAGFLPPNDDTGRGEGFMTYTVRPLESVGTGTEITNSAAIVFDTNEAILTNTALNTIDAGPPLSNVDPLPSVSHTDSFLLQWSGQDDAGGSGIAWYDVYVSEDGADYVPWVEKAQTTSEVFSGTRGHSYSFYSVATDHLGHTEAAPPLPDTHTDISALAAPEALGLVDSRVLANLDLIDGDLYYSLETMHDGFLTLEVLSPSPPKSVRLKLYDQDPTVNQGLAPLATSTLAGSNQRIAWAGSSGETYYVEVYGVNADFDLRITNLVHHVDSTVTVFGTDGDDAFEFSRTGSYQVTINGAAYHFDEAEVDTVQFDGGDGNDSASLNDSSGNDVYTATPDYALMVSPDVTVRVESCSVVQAYARNGGADTAVFIDSPDKDKVKVEDGNTVKMYSPNRSYYNRAKFFETVQANFSQGGAKDNARLWDSPASDVFDGVPGNSRYYSENTAFDVTVLGADFMTVYSTNGGNDKLILHDSPGDDVFRAKPHKVELFDRDTGGEVYEITARKFKDVTAYADQGGRDIAKLYDSTLDDLWEAEYRHGNTWSKMASTSRELYELIAFEQVKGYSVNGGTNTLRKRIVPPEIDFVLKHGDWEDAP